MKETETVSSSILTQKPVIFRKCGKLGRKCMRDRVVIKENRRERERFVLE